MYRLPAILIVGLMAAPAHAQHSAHVHGSGSLKLAVEDRQLMIELTSPAHDIVGFEHMPGNDDQRAAVSNAKNALSDGATLFGLPAAANCRQETVKIESVLLEGGHEHDDDHAHDAKHGEERSDDAKHEDDHADDANEHEDHAHGDKHEDEDTHSEFRAMYRFDCSNASELSGLSPAYFKLFPRAAVLTVEAISDAGQISVKLTPDAPNLALPGS